MAPILFARTLPSFAAASPLTAAAAAATGIPAVLTATDPIPRSDPAAPSCPSVDPVHPSLAAHAARVHELLPGLRVHADDLIDPVDAMAQGRCAPGLHLVILLEGALDLSYGQRRVLLNTAGERTLRDGSAARAVIVNVNAAEPFTRRLRRGAYARRVSLCISHDWLRALSASSGMRLPNPLDALVTGHLALHRWQPSARAVALAEQLVRPPSQAPMLDLLYQNSRLLDLLAEVLMPLQAGEPAPAPNAQSAPSAAVARRLRDLREFLNSDAADGLSLDEIARHAGMNVNTLQSHFRSAYGTTVFDFLREARLLRARIALERDGLSIKRAAALAGYGSAANFATAFGRRFGLTPTQARRAAQR